VSHTTPAAAAPPVESLAGPALAEAVAVALGWRWFLWPQRKAIALHHPDPSKREMWAPHFIDVTDTQQEYERFCDWDRYVPDYPNDIAAAWQVVDYMLPLCCNDFDLSTDSALSGDRQYTAEFGYAYTNKRPLTYGVAEGPTAPIAICRAALLALRAGKEVR